MRDCRMISKSYKGDGTDDVSVCGDSDNYNDVAERTLINRFI